MCVDGLLLMGPLLHHVNASNLAYTLPVRHGSTTSAAVVPAHIVIASSRNNMLMCDRRGRLEEAEGSVMDWLSEAEVIIRHLGDKYGDSQS